MATHYKCIIATIMYAIGRGHNSIKNVDDLFFIRWCILAQHTIHCLIKNISSTFLPHVSKLAWIQTYWWWKALIQALMPIKVLQESTHTYDWHLNRLAINPLKVNWLSLSLHGWKLICTHWCFQCIATYIWCNRVTHSAIWQHRVLQSDVCCCAADVWIARKP